jgi:nitrate/nitrite-specific signal transduction histidine kinase
MLTVVVLDLVVQMTAFGAAREFEARLARYHGVHRLRVAFVTHYKWMDEELRAGRAPGEDVFERDLSGFLRILSDIEAVEPESLDAHFNLRATRRGMEAYARAVAAAAQRRAAGDKDWYQDFATAGRIEAYVDGYLSSLLSETLIFGERRYREVAHRIANVRVATLCSLVFVAILFGGLAVAFSLSVTAPIRRLAAASERIAAGDLNVSDVTASTGDEIETLAHSFNAMSRSLRAMVEDLRGKAELERKLREEERVLIETEKALREAQFMSLQDQIRPHFLFNALNTIARTALFEGAGETERLTIALGKLFRYSLGSPDALVQVREEAAVLREYLAFQTLRFGKRLSWDIKVDARAESALIPRFTLQPLVENAVRHGIEPLESGGSVEVRVRRREDRVYLSVRDTGIGMDAKAARSLMSASTPEGIGLVNVRRRLALRYGGSERIEVRSAVGAGTLVRISFPSESGDRE